MVTAMRIATLLPSATEIVCALGARADLVGRSHECDFPGGIDDLPVLTSARVGALPSSAAIDRAVRDVLADALRSSKSILSHSGRRAPACTATRTPAESSAAPYG